MSLEEVASGARRDLPRNLRDSVFGTRDALTANLVNKIELGTRRPQATDIVYLAVAMGVTPDMLILPWNGDEEAGRWGAPDGYPSLCEGSVDKIRDWGIGGHEPIRQIRWMPGDRLARKLHARVLATPHYQRKLVEEPTTDTLKSLLRYALSERVERIAARWQTQADTVISRWRPLQDEHGAALADHVKVDPVLCQQFDNDYLVYWAVHHERNQVAFEVSLLPNWLVDQSTETRIASFDPPGCNMPMWLPFYKVIDTLPPPKTWITYDQSDPYFLYSPPGSPSIPSFDERWQ